MATTLHMVNKSPFSSGVLAQCIARFDDGDSLLLLEDGVYGALTTQPYAVPLTQLCCYAIEEDLIARGIHKKKLLANIQLIHYDVFVTLSIKHALSHSWY